MADEPDGGRSSSGGGVLPGRCRRRAPLWLSVAAAPSGGVEDPNGAGDVVDSDGAGEVTASSFGASGSGGSLWQRWRISTFFSPSVSFALLLRLLLFLILPDHLPHAGSASWRSPPAVPIDSDGDEDSRGQRLWRLSSVEVLKAAAASGNGGGSSRDRGDIKIF